jgi:hypothetical protein
LLTKMVEGNKPFIAAIEFLAALVSYASERVSAGIHTVEQVEEIWGDKLVSLWIIAKG